MHRCYIPLGGSPSGTGESPVLPRDIYGRRIAGRDRETWIVRRSQFLPWNHVQSVTSAKPAMANCAVAVATLSQLGFQRIHEKFRAAMFSLRFEARNSMGTIFWSRLRRQVQARSSSNARGHRRQAPAQLLQSPTHERPWANSRKDIGRIFN